ncbi:EF-hand calcium-binding domain-containing protein 5-like [Polypterus senegalus]|uniref:EF-hand calcium-binding domain-containing protein 5-like n=1 Tax=Polypterus senegalus TaxID=55291 RepID=UPI001965BFF6|nr:EF-hand calcium-binding domain-containing protein 5-like [Polypterus senegalus]
MRIIINMATASKHKAHLAASTEETGQEKGVTSPTHHWDAILEARVRRKAQNLQLQRNAELHQRQENEKHSGMLPTMELLNDDWFSSDMTNFESRMYLLEKLLPTLMPGVDSLLTEAEKRKLLEMGSVDTEVAGRKEPRQTFDPLNYLAQYLMRNNPRHCFLNPGGPYAQGLKQVVQELKQGVVDEENNRLAFLKQQIREKREQQNRAEWLQAQVGEWRRNALRAQFSEWLLEPGEGLQLKLVQNTLAAFLEILETDSFLSTQGLKFDQELSDEDQTLQVLQQEQFVEYVLSFISSFPTDIFERFLHHLSLCAQDYRHAHSRKGWKATFSQVFHDCDCGKTGLLDRQRVLVLLETFYNTSTESIRNTLLSPQHWPVREPVDVEFSVESDTEDEVDEIQTPNSSDTEMEAGDSESAGRRNKNVEEEQQIDSPVDPKETVDLVKNELAESTEKNLVVMVNTPNMSFEVGAPSPEPDSEDKDLLSPLDQKSWRETESLSAFNHSTVNETQFLLLLDTFLRDTVTTGTMNRLAGYLREGYKETEQERLDRLERAQREAVLAQWRIAVDELFDKWDNEGSGFLEQEEVERVLNNYKQGAEIAAMKRAWNSLASHTSILSRSQFHSLLQAVISELPPEGGKDSGFHGLLGFLTESVERSLAERTRGSTRRKWLMQIQKAAQAVGTSLEPVYRAVFQCLYKDAETHGNGKNISASLALLEGPDRLRYVACTAEDAPYVLNKELRREDKGVSFAALDQGNPVHIPRVRLHGNVHFWNTSRSESERKGSFLVLPLKDAHGRSFGVIGIDTLRDTQERNIFCRHEIEFYQGVSAVFSSAFQFIVTRRNILRVLDSASYWLHCRVPSMRSLTTYLMETSGQIESSYLLKKMMVLDNTTGHSRLLTRPAPLRRKDHLFRDYLFKCCDSSETLSCMAYGEWHVAVPMRDIDGHALGVMDIVFSHEGAMQPHERKDLQEMVRVTQMACSQLLRESSGMARQTWLLEAEGAGGEKRVGLLFLRFMLQDLRSCMRHLDQRSFAELKSYKEPPNTVLQIVRAVLIMLHPQWVETKETDSWNQCRLKVNSDLIRKVALFDPTAKSVKVDFEKLQQCISGIPRGDVWKHGSVPAEYLYNWVSVCFALLEQTGRVNQGKGDTLCKDIPVNETSRKNEAP